MGTHLAGSCRKPFPSQPFVKSKGVTGSRGAVETWWQPRPLVFSRKDPPCTWRDLGHRGNYTLRPSQLISVNGHPARDVYTVLYRQFREHVRNAGNGIPCTRAWWGSNPNRTTVVCQGLKYDALWAKYNIAGRPSCGAMIFGGEACTKVPSAAPRDVIL